MAEQDQTASEVAPSLCLKLSSRHSAWAVASPALGIATLAGTDNPRARGSRSLIGETSEADGGSGTLPLLPRRDAGHHSCSVAVAQFQEPCLASWLI